MLHIVFKGFILSLALCAGGAWAGAYQDLFKAIRIDDHRSVSALLQRGLDPNTVSENGVPAIFEALAFDSFDCAAAIVGAAQYRPNLSNSKDETPLMLAAIKGQHRLVQQMLAKGAEVQRSGWAPVHYAAASAEIRSLELILSHGADPNAKAGNGTTPLMMAAGYGDWRNVDALLKAGADAKPVNAHGFSAADMANRAGRQPLGAKLQAIASGKP